MVAKRRVASADYNRKSLINTPNALEAERTMPDIDVELAPGEKLLWTGKPFTGVVVGRGDVPFICIGLFFIIPTLVAMAIPDGREPVALVVMIPVLLIAGYVAFGRLFVNAWRRAKTVYAITNQRGIVVHRGAIRATRSVSLKNMPEMTLFERRSGLGSIILGAVYPWEYFRVAWAAPLSSLHMEHIEGVRAVYEILRAACYEDRDV